MSAQPVSGADHTQNPAAEPPPQHVVEHGDSLAAIARANGVSVSDLLEANPQIANPNVIYPGDRIALPAGAHASVAAEAHTGLGGPGEAFDYSRISGVQGNPNVSPAFTAEVEAMADRLGTRPEYLMAVMSFESAGTFSPSVENDLSGATGLIQFLPSTAEGLGTSTSALAQMSPVEQLQYVEAYFEPFSGQLNTLEGVYTAVLSGSPKPDPGTTLFSSGTAAYSQNAGLDANGDGRITSGEATAAVRARVDGPLPADSGAQPQPAPADPAPAPAPDNGGSAPAGNYVVNPGDTLSGIAARHNVSLDAVIAANPQIENPDLIYPGQNISLPGGGSGGSGGSHTVRPGDTLSAIAASNNVSLDAVIAANPQIGNPNLIYPGQAINIPGGGPAPGAAQPVDAAPAPAPAPAPAGDAPAYDPFTVYSTGEQPAINVSDSSQLQPHHDYTTQVRNGQTLEVRDVVLDRPGQAQNQQPVPAPISGEVIHAGPLGGAGNAVILQGENGQQVHLFHFSSVDVQVGQQVNYGQDLGNQGTTGNSTGEHVHIEAEGAVIDRWVNDLLDGRFDGQRTPTS